MVGSTVGELVEVQSDGDGVRTVTLNRPAAMNMLTAEVSR